MIVDKPVLGQLTQGTIFAAAKAENYSPDPVWGLCITARCDVAHENKTQVFNYVPVVRFEDWLLVDGGRLVIERIHNELFNEAKNCVKALNMSPSILDSYSLTEVSDRLFPRPADKESKNGQRFLKVAEQLALTSALRTAARLEKQDVIKACSFKSATAEKLLKDLWANLLQGYYLLKTIGETENSSSIGYVVLLREIHHIPRSVAHSVAQGVDKLSCEERFLNFSVFDFAYTTGKLRSPWIEHLMQQFALLFSRIGLTDPAIDTYNSLCDVLKNGN